MKRLILSSLLIFAIVELFAQPFRLSDPIPFNPATSKGMLKNGLTYYVKSNSTPKNRAEMMLVVSAGSVLEDSDQLGIAHFCEHMSFNGTQSFPKNELVKYFESIGMEFGPEINAYTSFDETVYMVKVPLDKEEYIQKGLQVLFDWASQVTDADDEINKERGVIHEEWRGGQGAQKRMMNQWLPVFLKNSKYAERLPIGEMEIIDKCKPEVLRRFRKDWYRPDLQAVIVVGDFDQPKMVKMIEEKFSAIPAQPNARKKENSPVPGHAETLVKIVTDKEATYSSASLYIKHPMIIDETVNGYRTSILNNLYNQMINLRLSELTQKENPPFVMGQAGYGGLIGPSDVYTSTAITHPGKIPAGLKTVLLENERIKKFGFTQTELNRNKAAMLKSMESAYNERDKRESMSIAQEYNRNFLMRKEPVPGIEMEFEYTKAFLPSITLEEVNALAKKWIVAENRVVVITAPETAGVPVPTEAEIKNLLTEVQQQNIDAYADETSSEPLMKSVPVAGKITKRKKITEADATEWTLSNGSKVVVKQTDFKDDEILFTGYSWGGSSLYPQSDNISASFASTIMDMSGIAGFKLNTLKKMLSGKEVSVTPVIKMMTQGIEGSSNVSDIETLFQLINLYFTHPRFEESAFSSYIMRMKSQLDNKDVSPESAFADTFRFVSANYHPRMKPMTKEMLDEAKYTRIEQIGKERFANPGAFTYFFVGKIDTLKLKPLVEKYLASLTSGKKIEHWVDLGIRKPYGVVEKIVNKGKESKSIQYIQFHGKLNYVTKDILELDALSKILSTRLLESIREDKSSVYYIGAQPGTSKWPVSEYDMTIYYGTSPEKLKELKESVFATIRDLIENGPKQEEVDKAREKMKRERETNLRENSYWEATLKTYYLNKNGDFKTFREFDGVVDGLNINELKSAASRIFNFKNYISVALMPEISLKAQ
ncbi:MAG: insulinase family protein [Mariniphaga sp.]